MKKFYKLAAVQPQGAQFAITLDGRPIKTPQRHPLLLPNGALAEAIAAEWESQVTDIKPETMPLTALAQGALDQVAEERERIVGRIAAFADSDMLYYRADDSQQALIDHQAAQWDPLLAWAQSRYDVSFQLIYGIKYQPQPAATVERLSAAVAAYDDFTIAAMLSLVGLAGSLIATLALVEDVYSAEQTWPLVNLEELWQEAIWGVDEQAAAVRARKQAEFQAAVRFLQLSGV